MTAADEPRAVRPPTDRLALALIVLAVGLFAWTAVEGRAAGLHRILPEAISRHEPCVAIAVSDLRYGLNRGYVSYRAVGEELARHGWTWDPTALEKSGLTYPDNMTDRDRLDFGLERAANLPDPAAGGVQHLPLFAEDVGYTDFVKLGFVLFGIKLGSLYSAYFLVLGAGVALYLVAYRRDVPMLLLLVAFQIGFFVLVRTLPGYGHFDEYPPTRFQLGTVINGRFLGTLGLVPFLHLAGCLLTWPRATVRSVAAAAGQGVLLAAALHFRGSAMWIFAALFVLAAAPAAAWLWRNRRTLLTRPFTVSAGGRVLAARWPAAVVLLALVGQKAYVGSAAHWLYYADDGLPNHLFWHNALMALECHPEWPRQSIYVPRSGDSLAWAAVDNRLDEEGIGREYHVSPLTRVYKARLHDQVCRRLYLDFVARNPRYTAELFLWHKPRILFTVLGQCWGWVQPQLGRPDVVGLLAGFGGLVVLAARRPGGAGWRVPVGIAAAGLAGAALPLFWAYPIFHVMGEFLILGGMLVAGLGAVAVGAVARARPTAPGWRVRLPGAAGRVAK